MVSTQKAGRVGKPPRTVRACDNCRKRKIKCSGSAQCLNCVASGLQCSYSQDGKPSQSAFLQLPMKLNHDLLSLQDSLKYLSKQLSPGNCGIKGTIETAISALNEIDLESFGKIQYEEIANYAADESIETAMMKVPHFIDRFSIGATSKCDQPLNGHLGLYTPFVYLSPGGLSFLLKRLMQIRDGEDTRVTMCLLFRLLDFNAEVYASRDVKSSLTGDLLSQLEGCIRMLPSNVDNELALLRQKTMKRPSDMLESCVYVLQRLHSTFDEPILNLSSVELYIKCITKLADICYEGFAMSAFTWPFGVLRPEVLIEVVEKLYWASDLRFTGGLIALTGRLLLDFGYGRWEYYVGISEKLADGRRRAWWHGFWWDRWYAVSTGHPPSIPESLCDCLFPRDVMALNVDESMDCLSLAKGVNLRASDPETTTSFIYILLAKTITLVFSSVLYNKDFTCYRHYSKGSWGYKESRVNDLRINIDHLYEIIELLDTKLAPIIEIDFQNQDRCQASMFIRMTIAYISHAVCSFLMRLKKCLSGSQKQVVEDMVKRAMLQVSHNSETALLNVLKLNDTKDLTKYGSLVSFFMLNLASQAVDNPAGMEEERFFFRITVMFGICDRFKTFGGVQLRNRLVAGISFCFISARIFCQVYMGTHDKSMEQLFTQLNENNELLTSTARGVLDFESPLFANLATTRKQSMYSQSVLQHGEMKPKDAMLRDSNQNENRKDVNEEVRESDTPPKEVSGTISPDPELDFFMMANSLDDLTTFWDEVLSRGVGNFDPQF